jgi:Abortive infection alpha
MSNEEPLKVAKDGLALVGEVIKAAGDNPQVKEAAGNLGQTAITLTKTINNVLVPLAAINFAFDKARIYFSGKFQHDLEEKTQKIPAEHIVEPKASIAGPTLQGLAFAHEEPSLKEMYLSLLVTSMDGRITSDAHPAFVEIIKQLDSEDARLVKAVLVSESSIPIVQIRRQYKDGAFNVLVQHLVDLKSSETGLPMENLQIPSMIDNWIRLGLVEVDYSKQLSETDLYSWVQHRPEFFRLRSAPQKDHATIDCQEGVLGRTELGKRFAQAVGLL